MTDDTTPAAEGILGTIAHEIEAFLHPAEGSAEQVVEGSVEQADPTLTETVAPVVADAEALAPAAEAVVAAVEAPTPGAVVAAAETVLSPTTEEALGKLLADTGTALDGLSTQGTQELDAARNALGTLRTSLFAHISKWGL